MIWRIVPAAAALACTATLAACDSGSDRPRETHQPPASHAARSEPDEEESGERRDVPGVPAADRVAYYQLATTTGTLRLAVSAAATGRVTRVRPREHVALRAADRRLRGLEPRDRTLRATLAMLSPSVHRVGSASRLSRRGARAALGVTARASSRLRGYLRRHPGLAAKLPD